jgi:hypothetical protein
LDLGTNMLTEDTTKNADVYWATEEPDRLIQSLEDKWRDYNKYLKNSLYYRRVLRNLAYIHGQFFGKITDSIDLEVSRIGEEDNMIGYGVNHFRSLLDHIFQFAAGDRLALKCRAVNSDNEALHQARLGTSILDYYQREKGLEDKVRSAAWHSLIFAQGFIKHTWDPDIGKPTVQEPPQASVMEMMAGGDQLNPGLPGEMPGNMPPGGEVGFPPPVPTFEGDVSLDNPTILDLAWNIARPWTEKSWIIARSYKNRWDLLAKLPEKADDILKYEEDRAEKLAFYKGLPEPMDEDQIPVFEFFHRKTEAVPTGRYCQYIPGTWFYDTELPYEDIPISRISAGEWIGQGTGWTPAFSLQAPQEMLNGELSSIVTNHAAFASQGLWVPPGAERLKLVATKKGPRIYTSAAKPEPLQFLAPHPELHKMADKIVADMQLVVGVSGATRGIAEAGVTAGNALALLDAKSVQANSPFVYSYQHLGEDVGTAIVRMIRKFSKSPRTVVILGKANMPYQQYFTGKDLELVDKVVVESVNPLTKTLAGKDAKAKDLIAIGAVRNVEQYNQVYETGNLEPMFEAERSQLSVIREENEALLRGEPVAALDTDNHLLHCKEHPSVLCTKENRNNPQIVQNVLAHEMEHIKRSMQPGVQLIQQFMGYPTVQMPMGMAPPGQANTQTMGSEPPVVTPNGPPGGGSNEIKTPKQAIPPPQSPKQVPQPIEPSS